MFFGFSCPIRRVRGKYLRTMNTNSDHPASKKAAQEEFLRDFLANERKIFQ